MLTSKASVMTCDDLATRVAFEAYTSNYVYCSTPFSPQNFLLALFGCVVNNSDSDQTDRRLHNSSRQAPRDVRTHPIGGFRVISTLR